MAPSASLLGVSTEIRMLIFEELIRDPACDPNLLFQFFLLTCHEISNETQGLVRQEFGDANSKNHALDDWRLNLLDKRLTDLAPLQLNLVHQIDIDAMCWNADAEDLDDPSYAKLDDEGFKFWECYDEPLFWLLEIIERFPGLKRMELSSDPHGYMWSCLWDFLEQGITDDSLEQHGIQLGWSIGAVDQQADKFTLSLKSLEEENRDVDWRLRDRSVIVWLVSGY